MNNRLLSRRGFLKTLFGSGILAACIVPAYAFFFERTWYQVKRLPMPVLKPGSRFTGVRVVQFSDLHFGHSFQVDQLQTVVNEINGLHPDVVCFTGDFVDYDVNGIDRCIPYCKGFGLRSGKFAVPGNHDYFMDEKRVRDVLSASGFTLLINRHVFIRRREEYLHIAGVDDVLHGKPDLVKALHGLKENDPTLLLAHEPDFADAAARYKNVVLQLSGHSHGGQIRLPFIGHLVVPPMARKYVMGLYEVGASNMLLYTNRGIGTTSFPVRLNCRP